MRYQRSVSGSPPGYEQYSGSPSGYVQQLPQYSPQQYSYNPFQPPPQSLPQLTVPTNDEHSVHSAPAAGNLAAPQVPQLLRTVSYDGSYFRRFGAFARPQQYVTQRATEICEYEERHMEGDVMPNTVPYQSSPTPEQHLITNGDEAIQYAISDHMTQPPALQHFQRQFSEFPLDQVRV